MTAYRASLIARVFEWDRVAVQLGRSGAVRSGLWRIIDALYADSEYFRSPEFLRTVKAELDAMKETDAVKAIRQELGLGEAEDIDEPVWAGRVSA